MSNPTSKNPVSNRDHNPKWEVFRFFTWLGLIGFGGPQAHIALMQAEAQEKRAWLTKEEFSEALAVCNILPGPASTQLVTYLGWLRGGGWLGGIAAALGFIWPAFAMMLMLSWLYFSFGALPQVNAFFYGLKPVVVAIVLATSWRLSQPSRSDWRFWLLTALSAVLIGGQFINDFLVFVGAALLGLLLYPIPPKPTTTTQAQNNPPTKKLNANGLLSLLSAIYYAVLSPQSAVLNPQSSTFLEHSADWERLFKLGWFFGRAGALIFGGGLVIIPLIQNEIVMDYGWLSSQQFLDGAALGQATPGPVLITAAFVGYASAGIVGALVATFCIFLPGLTLILLAAPALQKVRQFPPARAALSGVNGAVVGSLLAGAYFIARTAFLFPASGSGPTLGDKLLDPYTVGLALLALFLIVRYKLNTIYLFLGAGLFGLVLSWLPFRLIWSGLPL